MDAQQPISHSISTARGSLRRWVGVMKKLYDQEKALRFSMEPMVTLKETNRISGSNNTQGRLSLQFYQCPWIVTQYRAGYFSAYKVTVITVLSMKQSTGMHLWYELMKLKWPLHTSLKRLWSGNVRSRGQNFSVMALCHGPSLPLKLNSLCCDLLWYYRFILFVFPCG